MSFKRLKLSYLYNCLDGTCEIPEQYKEALTSIYILKQQGIYWLSLKEAVQSFWT